MAKRCVPGVICIENLTMTLLIIIILIVLYVVYSQRKDTSSSANNNTAQHPGNVRPSDLTVAPPSIVAHPLTVAKPSLNNPYIPPLKTDGVDPRIIGLNGPVVPVNIETRGLPTGYSQIGILTNNGVILPLMGRRTMMGRDRWQYYTVTTTGNMNTKLPVRVNGKNGMSEYGCDEIYDGDSVFVEGYNESYRATIYENAALRYL